MDSMARRALGGETFRAVLQVDPPRSSAPGTRMPDLEFAEL